MTGLLRYDSQFDVFVDAVEKNPEILPFSRCKKIVSASYLQKHLKTCVSYNSSNDSYRKGDKTKHKSLSATMMAAADKKFRTASTVRLVQKVFSRLNADEAGMLGRKDLLIRLYGESYLRRHKPE